MIIGLFYVLCSYAWVIGAGLRRLRRGRGRPRPTRGERLGDFWGAGWVLIFFAIINSALANSNAGVNAATRVLYAMGRNGVLPSAFGRIHPEHKTPHVAIVAQTRRSASSSRS